MNCDEDENDEDGNDHDAEINKPSYDEMLKFKTERKISKMSRVRVDHQQAQLQTTSNECDGCSDDRRLSLRMIAEELKISLDSVSNIIHEHLQKRKKKVCAFPTLRRSSNV
ncbi:hypothetical protein AVEN_64168-1 [Araneus ventricosus]|uniref:Uncharacterized protein n=1 Tax=Araneus ventricosus TaxID=182803 RepID=A0A4Y2QDU7_ARAVE|nr:hypothetical protein AVEN_64168-1 [Araneus ventricosus]